MASRGGEGGVGGDGEDDLGNRFVGLLVVFWKGVGI